jgi:GNAT superfamily N-acetyltransferase
MIFVNNKKSNILLKAAVLMVACVFFIDTVAYAAPSYSNATNLAAGSRFKPFSERHGLDFQGFAMAALAAGELRDKINAGILRKRHILDLNKGLTKIGVSIDAEIGERELKTSKGSRPNKYKYVTFNFGEDKKRIEARFIKDYESLTEDELKELGIRTHEDEGYFISSPLPNLEGVWFVDADAEAKLRADVEEQRDIKEKEAGLVSNGFYSLLPEVWKAVNNAGSTDNKAAEHIKCFRENGNGLVFLGDSIDFEKAFAFWAGLLNYEVEGENWLYTATKNLRAMEQGDKTMFLNRARNAVGYLTENVHWHAHGYGAVIAGYDETSAAGYIAVLDNGEGFPVDAEGKLDIELVDGGFLKQKSPHYRGDGIAMGRVIEIGEVTVISRGQVAVIPKGSAKPEKIFAVPYSGPGKEEIQKMKGSAVIVHFRSRNPDKKAILRELEKKAENDTELESHVTRKNFKMGVIMDFPSLIGKGIAPVRILKDRKKMPRYAAVIDRMDPSNSVVLCIDYTGEKEARVSVVGEKGDFLISGVGEGSTPVHFVDLEAGRRFYSRLMKPASVIKIDRIVESVPEKGLFYSHISLSRDPAIAVNIVHSEDPGIERVWLTPGHGDEDSLPGKKSAALLIDRKKIERSFSGLFPPLWELEDPKGEFAAYPADIAPVNDWVRIKQGEKYEYFFKVGIKNIGGKRTAVYRRIDKKDRITAIEISEDRRTFSVEGLLLDGGPLLIEPGSLDLGTLLHVLSNRHSRFLEDEEYFDQNRITISGNLEELIAGPEQVVSAGKSSVPAVWNMSRDDGTGKPVLGGYAELSWISRWGPETKEKLAVSRLGDLRSSIIGNIPGLSGKSSGPRREVNGERTFSSLTREAENVTIVKAMEQDAEWITGIWEAELYPVLKKPDDILERGERKKRFRKYLENRIRGREGFVLAATLDGKIVGFVTCDIFRETGLGVIQYMAVTKSHRGEGIGTKLFSSAAEKFREYGEVRKIIVNDLSLEGETGNMARRAGFLEADEADQYYLDIRETKLNGNVGAADITEKLGVVYSGSFIEEYVEERKEKNEPVGTITASPGKERTIAAADRTAAEEAEMIHRKNLELEYLPTIPKKTILCHVITDSILPVGQRYDMLKVGLEQGMRGEEYREKIAVLSILETAGAEEFMAELERVKARVRNENKGYKIEFTVACPDIEGLVEQVQSTGLKALAFKREGEGDIVQAEGILLALRALYTGNINSLIRIYKFLTGQDIMDIPDGKDEKEIMRKLTRQLVFTMPLWKVDDAARINDLIRDNILTAA